MRSVNEDSLLKSLDERIRMFVPFYDDCHRDKRSYPVTLSLIVLNYFVFCLQMHPYTSELMLGGMVVPHESRQDKI